MKNILIGCVFSLILISCNQEKYNIKISINGVKNDSALIVVIPQSNRDIEFIDTVQFLNGKLNYNHQVCELHEVFVIPFKLFYKFENGESYPLPASRIHFFIDSSEVINVIAAIDEQCIDYDVQGNLISEGLSIARKMKIPLFKERIKFEYEYNKIQRSELTQSDKDRYWKQRELNNEKYNQQNVSFIESYPNSEYSPRLLLEIRDKKQVTELYEKLSDSVKNSYFGIVVEDMIYGWTLQNPNSLFPNINDTTVFGKDISLYNYKGKHVLIDFWGSWCSPCLAEITELKELTEKYENELVLIGIACNDNYERLVKIIETENITWPIIMEKDIRKFNYSQRFGVRSFPTKVLLDRESKVINTYNGIDKKLYHHLDSLFIN